MASVTYLASTFPSCLMAMHFAGYKKIRENFESEHLEMPTFSIVRVGFMANVKHKVFCSIHNDVGNVSVNQLTERQRKIYHLIAASATITAKQMSVMLSVTERTIERDLAAIQKNGSIRHEGKAKTGHWIVLI